MATAGASAHASSNSRSSFDKARAIKMFSNSRASESNSSANDGSRSHKRSDSILSDGMKRTITAFNGGSDATSFGTTSLDVSAVVAICSLVIILTGIITGSRVR